MTTFAHNLAPSHPLPLDRRDGAPSVVVQLARQFKLATNSALLSEADLIDLGEPRLRELLAMAANVRQAPAAQPRADDFAGYSMNALMDHIIGGTDGDLLRLATEVQTLIRGANGVKMTALGETQLKALKAHFEQA